MAYGTLTAHLPSHYVSIVFVKALLFPDAYFIFFVIVNFSLL